ncbi:hypothetical protein Pmani_000730 [Petrolisthes manimaculis]|uniref:Uncharacterized protein n=1 Tax=Petrolisthes manimaculis TaxID=1843537 RepID=A0AAE1USD4_9EUCA|nr:hypothetical protein Pmani_000730 [Petrolisthes manimaculis]
MGFPGGTRLRLLGGAMCKGWKGGVHVRPAPHNTTQYSLPHLMPITHTPTTPLTPHLMPITPTPTTPLTPHLMPITYTPTTPLTPHLMPITPTPTTPLPPHLLPITHTHNTTHSSTSCPSHPHPQHHSLPTSCPSHTPTTPLTPPPPAHHTQYTHKVDVKGRKGVKLGRKGEMELTGGEAWEERREGGSENGKARVGSSGYTGPERRKFIQRGKGRVEQQRGRKTYMAGEAGGSSSGEK